MQVFFYNSEVETSQSMNTTAMMCDRQMISTMEQAADLLDDPDRVRVEG